MGSISNPVSRVKVISGFSCPDHQLGWYLRRGHRRAAVVAVMLLVRLPVVTLRNGRKESNMVAKTLERPALVLNRNWQPVNVATVARALVLLWNESARVVDPADYQTYTWDDWSKLRPRDDERFIQAVRVAAARAGSDCADRLRPAARGGRHVQPAEHFQARPLRVPVLRPPAGQRGTDDRPRRAAGAGWRVEVGQLRAGLRDVQQAKGRPHAAAGGMRLRKQPVRPTWNPLYAAHDSADRKLVEVRQRGVLERRTGEVKDNDRSRFQLPGALCLQLHECAPGRTASFRAPTEVGPGDRSFDSPPRAACRRGSTERDIRHPLRQSLRGSRRLFRCAGTR